MDKRKVRIVLNKIIRLAAFVVCASHSAFCCFCNVNVFIFKLHLFAAGMWVSARRESKEWVLRRNLKEEI